MNYYQEKIETNSLIPAKIYFGYGSDETSHYPLHWHSNLEFDLVISGMIRGVINGIHVDVYPGEFFFVNSGELHETSSDDISKLNTVTILLSNDLLREYCKDIDSYYFDFSGREKAKRKVKRLIIECAYLYEQKEDFYELEISIVLRKICSILLNECKKEKQEKGYYRYEQKNMKNIKKAIGFMEKNFSSSFSLDDIASEIGMSPNYFSRFFKKNTGETFYSYLNKIRLYYAHRELLNSDRSVTEIAYDNGFANVKSFIEVFKRAYNTTPSRYKKNIEH